MATTRSRSATATAEKPKRRSTPRRRPVTQEDVAARAYAIFEAGGEGDHVDHWLQAERELAAPRRR